MVTKGSNDELPPLFFIFFFAKYHSAKALLCLWRHVIELGQQSQKREHNLFIKEAPPDKVSNPYIHIYTISYKPDIQLVNEIFRPISHVS